MRDDPTSPAAADPFGDVFLVIDGWPAFVAEFPDLEPVVQDLAGQGLAYGVHTVISTPRWTELKSRIRDYLGTKVEFRLGDVNETQIDRITREIPANRPGRGISMEKHHLMMGVPRLDGVHSALDIVAGDLRGRRAHRVPAHGSGATGARATRPHLPARARPTPPGPESDYRTRWTIPIGVRESDLSVAYGPMHTTPHLIVFGAPKSGKTTIAHAVASAICARKFAEAGPVHAGRLPVGPPRRRPAEPSARGGRGQPKPHVARGVRQGARRDLEEPAATGGPDHRAAADAVVVDRTRRRPSGRRLAHDRGRERLTPPMTPLGPLLPAAADIGLHIVVTCQMSQAHRATMDRFVGAAFGAGSPTLFLSGEKMEFPTSEFKLKRRPPGQGLLVSPDGKEVVQAAYVDPPEEEVFAAPLDAR